jgi:ADP-ribosylglycohydrolase
MLGAIAGDIIGSPYERHQAYDMDFPLFRKRSHFTDDSVLTTAVAHAILNDGDYASSMKMFGRRYPRAGYGGAFKHWIWEDEVIPYNSWGNGSAMRVSPVGFAFDSPETVLEEAKTSAECSHNHPEGIKGAQAVALAVFLAKKGCAKEDIRKEISGRFNYDLSRTLEEIRPTYHFHVSCQQTAPEAIIAFLESENYEEAVRQSIFLGGDSDTLACIAGGIAQAYYKELPSQIVENVRRMLTEDLLEVVDQFRENFGW